MFSVNPEKLLIALETHGLQKGNKVWSSKEAKQRWVREYRNTMLAEIIKKGEIR